MSRRTVYPEKYCVWCGRKIIPRIYENGKGETLHDFSERKYCNIKCFGEARRKNLYQKKTCVSCGEVLTPHIALNGVMEAGRTFNMRKYCNRDCYKAAKVKGESFARRTVHHYAHRDYCEEECNSCGVTKGLVVHHIDGNWKNNIPENFLTLCASCHMKLHQKQRKEGKILCKF